MPGEANARLEIFGGRRQRLPVVTQAEVDGEIRLDVKSILDERGQKPLWQFIAADAEIDWLLIILHIREGQLIERQSAARAGAQESKSTQDGRAWLAAGAAR